MVNSRIVNASILNEMSTQPIVVWVFRDNKWSTIYSDQLVPGDLIGLTSGSRPVPIEDSPTILQEQKEKELKKNQKPSIWDEDED